MELKKEIERINAEIKKLQDQKDKLERDHYSETCEINKSIMQKLYDSIKLCIQDHKDIINLLSPVSCPIVASRTRPCQKDSILDIIQISESSILRLFRIDNPAFMLLACRLIHCFPRI